MIINETAARRYFRGENPIGRSIALVVQRSSDRRRRRLEPIEVPFGPRVLPVSPAVDMIVNGRAIRVGSFHVSRT
jgi:hypothetical protein